MNAVESGKAREDLMRHAAEMAEFALTAAKEGLAAHEAEHGIWTRMLQFGRRTLEHFFACVGDGDSGETLELPDGRTVRRLPARHGREYHSVFGALRLAQVVYGTREGQRIEYAPLDARLQLPESKFSYLLQDWDQCQVVEQSYKAVSEGLSRILGFTQPVDSLERMNAHMAQWVPEFLDSLPVPPPEEEGAIGVVSADGKGVPMRCSSEQLPIEAHQPKKGPKPDTKKMALLGAVYTVDPVLRAPEEVVTSLFRDPTQTEKRTKRDRPKPRHKRLRASLARSEEGTTAPAVETVFTWLARDMAARAGATKEVCVLMDGQESLWRAAGEHFSGANVTQILDLLHVTPRLWSAATLFHPKSHGAAVGFVKDRVLRILQGKAVSVTRGLRSMGKNRCWKGKKKQSLDKICGYLEKNTERMRYDEYLKAGYPIATGVIEGACRHLVKDRLERAGMRWGLPGAQSMLNLRSVYLSGLWDEFTAYRIKRETQRLYQRDPNAEGLALARAA